jgi:glycosyltransferase involved in cell wall biosynthesis
MKISVLTPSFNSAKTIGRTLDSFCAQDWPDKEMIVLDGASGDGTQAIVRAYAGQNIRLISGPDKGMYDGLNKGLRLYGGEAVGVLNSDDAYADSRVLSRIGAALAGADMVHASLDFRDASGRIVRQWRARARPAKGFREGWMPAHPTFYVRRQVADTVGAFDISLSTAADYDWMLRAIETTRSRLATLDESLIDMAIGGRSTRSLGAYVSHNLEALASRRRWLGSGLVDYALFAKPAGKIGQFISAAMPVPGKASQP